MKNLYHVSCFVHTDTQVSGYFDGVFELADPQVEPERWLYRLRKALADHIALSKSLTFFDPKYIAIIGISKL